MARLAKATQRALDELDRSCSADDIHDWFIPRAREVLGNLPCLCFDSLERVVLALAKSQGNDELPTGYGSPCVRHFDKRSEQLGRISNKISMEHRFALIELTSLASIANRWSDSRQPRVAQASHKGYLRHTTEPEDTFQVTTEQWRAVLKFVLNDECSTPAIFRNVAYALVWCGYFSPDSFATDEQLAGQFFGEDRAEFNRFRQDGLRLLTMLLKLSIHSSVGGVS